MQPKASRKSGGITRNSATRPADVRLITRGDGRVSRWVILPHYVQQRRNYHRAPQFILFLGYIL